MPAISRSGVNFSLKDCTAIIHFLQYSYCKFFYVDKLIPFLVFDLDLPFRDDLAYSLSLSGLFHIEVTD